MRGEGRWNAGWTKRYVHIMVGSCSCPSVGSNGRERKFACAAGDDLRGMAQGDEGKLSCLRPGLLGLRPDGRADLAASEHHAISVGIALRGAALPVPGARGKDRGGAVGGAGVAVHVVLRALCRESDLGLS